MAFHSHGVETCWVLDRSLWILCSRVSQMLLWKKKSVQPPSKPLLELTRTWVLSCSACWNNYGVCVILGWGAVKDFSFLWSNIKRGAFSAIAVSSLISFSNGFPDSLWPSKALFRHQLTFQTMLLFFYSVMLYGSMLTVFNWNKSLIILKLCRSLCLPN